jgi:hypothetical protein
MPHQYNRHAFQGGITSPDVLLSAYCALVDLELGIKDHFVAGGWRAGHRIIDWVAELGEGALAVQLAGKLGSLRCTGRDGNVAPVAGNAYPDVRYIRHESDFAGMSTDDELREVVDVVSDIRAALKGRGVSL